MGFLGIAMLGWQAASRGERRWLGLLAIGFGVSGMLVSHAFSPLLVVVLCVAEFIRSLNRRKIDWPVWIALLAPSPFVIIYIPMLSTIQGLDSSPSSVSGLGT